MSGQGFFKGEKKKQKKDKQKSSYLGTSDRPSFVLPDVIDKKKRYE